MQDLEGSAPVKPIICHLFGVGGRSHTATCACPFCEDATRSLRESEDTYTGLLTRFNFHLKNHSPIWDEFRGGDSRFRWSQIFTVLPALQNTRCLIYTVDGGILSVGDPSDSERRVVALWGRERLEEFFEEGDDLQSWLEYQPERLAGRTNKDLLVSMEVEYPDTPNDSRLKFRQD